MRKIFDFLHTAISEDFGIPMNLIKLIKKSPELCVTLEPPRRTLCPSSVVDWAGWGKHHDFYARYSEAGRLNGRKRISNYFESATISIPELLTMSTKEKFPGFQCDIQDIKGISASKSDLLKFTDIDDMVIQNANKMVDDISLAGLKKNIEHKGVDILREDSKDYLKMYRWDGTIFLVNSDGSHHFAAARYIASRINEPVPITAELVVYSLKIAPIAEMRRKFEIFAISDEAEIINNFFDAMTSFRSTFYWHNMPKQYSHAKAIFLPKNEKRSMKVASVLREAGAFDLGEYLEKLAYSQN